MRDKERQLYERLLAEKERMIEHLALEKGTYFPAEQPPALPTRKEAEGDLDAILADMGVSFSDDYMSEDEQEIKWQVANGVVSPEAAAAFLQAMHGEKTLDQAQDEHE